MVTHKYLFTLLTLLLPMLMHAQKLMVKSMEVASLDLLASINPRLDLNGNPCALVRVILKDDAPKFEGNVLGTVEKKGLAYLVYMSAGTKMLRVVPSNSFPLVITFADHGIKALEGKMTYDLTLYMVDVQSQPQFSFIHSSSGVNTYMVGTVLFNMIRVEGGTFKMGSNGHMSGRGVSPVHKVTLDSYSLGETEVTQELWEAVMGSNPSKFNGARRPVEQVSWDDCQEFIIKLNEISGQHFRLPTEAEWEYAARGGNVSNWYPSKLQLNIAGLKDADWHIDSVAVYEKNSRHRGENSPEYGPHNVGTKKPNELGFYDMSGNVWEWCHDWYAEYTKDNQTNPSGPLSGSFKVMRGGSWQDNSTAISVTYRYLKKTTYSHNSLGFRLAQ